MLKSTGSRVFIGVVVFFYFRFGSYYGFVFGTNKLQMFTASFNSPPDCLLSPKRLRSAPSFLSCSKASFYFWRLFGEMSQNDITCFRINFPENGTDLISTSSKTNWELSVFLTNIFNVNLGVLEPLSNCDISSLKSFNDISIWIIASALSFKTALSAGNFIGFFDNQLVFLRLINAPIPGILTRIIDFELHPSASLK